MTKKNQWHKLGLAALLVALLTAGAIQVNAATNTNSTTVLACVQTAVQTRDTSIITAETAFATAWNTALTTRRDALKAAWEQTDQTTRRAAIKAAWKEYRTSRTTAFTAWIKGRNAAWKQWNADRKTCKASAADDNGSKSMDMISEPTS